MSMRNRGCMFWILVSIILLALLAYWLFRPESYRFENDRTRGVEQHIPENLPTGRTVFVNRSAGALDRMEMFYREAGNPENPPIILIHGISGDSGTTWYNTYPQLSQDYYVLGLDLRGHGFTMQPPVNYSIEMMADDVAAFMDAMNIDAAYVAGHSMGGLVAMQLAHQHPQRVQALVLLDTSAEWSQGILAYGMPLYPYIVRAKNRLVGWEQENRDRASAFTFHEVDPHYQEWIYQRRDLNQIEPFLASWNAINDFSAINYLPSLELPVLIIYGEDDDLVPVEFRNQLNDLIPNSRMEIIPSPARHYPQIQFADLVHPLILSFMEDHPMN